MKFLPHTGIMTTNRLHKKDLGMIAKNYGYVYVAQVAMGTSQAQYFSRRPRTPLNKSNEVSCQRP